MITENRKAALRRTTALLTVVILSVTLLTACIGGGSQNPPADGTEKLQIVTTIFPAYDFARQVAGDRAEVTMLLSPGEELHSYEPTPGEMIAIEECDVFIYVGGESDTWMKDVLEAVDVSGKTVISMMEETDVLTEEITEGMAHAHEDGEICDDSDHVHEAEYDEHVWTSPANAQVIVSAIADKLCEIDPEGENYYRERELGYLGELEELKEDLLAIRERAKRTTIIVGDRFPFRYLVEFLDLEYYAAFPGCAEETEPSAKTVAFLIDKIREEQIPVVFYQEFSSHMMAEVIAEDTGAIPLLLHSCHNVTKDELEAGVTYVEIMRQNASNLELALCR